jgi:hypothetical protein
MTHSPCGQFAICTNSKACAGSGNPGRCHVIVLTRSARPDAILIGRWQTQEAALQTALIHNLRVRSVLHLGTFGEHRFLVLDRRLELGAAVVMEF